MAEAAKKNGMKKKDLWHCQDPKEATGILKKIARPGDAVLVKGSRSMAMERVIKGL